MIPVKLFFTNSRKRELFFHHIEREDKERDGKDLPFKATTTIVSRKGC